CVLCHIVFLLIFGACAPCFLTTSVYHELASGAIAQVANRCAGKKDKKIPLCGMLRKKSAARKK
ncbi:MAG: hypothetical protein ACI4OL_09040, partial [Gemmiger sp.]